VRTDLLRLALLGPRLVLRALNDLNTIAENARRQPDAVDEIKARLDALLLEATAVRAIASDVVARADALDLIAHELVTDAHEILSAAAALQQTGGVLDGHSTQIIERGEDLIVLSRSLDETLTVFRQHLPRVLRALDTVEELEDAAETMADTMEPLQGAAERVGRITKRLSRSSHEQRQPD
jgi:hypothetical protein